MFTFKVKRTKYTVTRDTYCWNLCRYKTTKSGEEIVESSKYYNKLSDLAEKLLDLSVDAPTKEDFNVAVASIVKGLSKGIMQEINK